MVLYRTNLKAAFSFELKNELILSIPIGKVIGFIYQKRTDHENNHHF